MLKVSQLCFEYADFPLFHGVNFTVKSGQLLHIKGQNGAGKSTLLKLLATLLQPSSGEILFREQSLSHGMETYRNKMSYIGHLEGIHPLLTPQDVWRYEMAHEPGSLSLSEVLDLLDLSMVSDMPFVYLSAGQKKRVGMMRLIMRTPLDVWLLDEPWVSLDAIGASLLESFIHRHLSLGGCVVVTSHQPLPFSSSFVSEYVL